MITLLPIDTFVKLLQYWNALSPIEVTSSGIVTLVKLLQPENARFPIEVTPSGIVISPIADGYAISLVLSLLKRIAPEEE